MCKSKKNGAEILLRSSCRHLAIFPVRRQTSIFAIDELNFRVRNGNGWTLIIINTNCGVLCTLKTEQRRLASQLSSLRFIFQMKDKPSGY